MRPQRLPFRIGIFLRPREAGQDDGLPKPGAPEPHDGRVERGEEAGAVARRERFWAAGDLAGAAQRIHQIARRQRQPDRVLGERAAVWRDHVGAGFDAAARQRHVRGDDDVAAPGALGDPVVRLVHARADDDSLHKLIPRHRDRLLLTTRTLSATPLSACRSATR